MFDNEVGAALQRFNDSLTKKAQELEQAIRDEDA